MKTITISDDVYEKLVKIKGKKSFSATIEELIRRNTEKRIEMLIRSAEKRVMRANWTESRRR